MIQLALILIALAATLIGAITGIGGGIVIKTLYDVIGIHSILEIGYYTTIVVFTMSIISIYKQYRHGFKYDLPVLLSISLGSMIGGYVGDWTLNLFVNIIPQERLQLIQSSILLLTLVFLLAYTHFKKDKSFTMAKTPVNALLLGVFLGTNSIFLGIGGGPLNVSLLVILFGFTMKEASIYSIATVFFSQITKIFTIIVREQYLDFEFDLVPWLIIVGIVGSFYGTRINQKISNAAIEKIYDVFMVSMILLTMFNIYRFW